MSTIVATNIYKRFRKGQENYHTLREDAYGLARKLLGRSNHIHGIDSEHIWALQDISFELQKGQTLGLIGNNGSGKTTMLRILSGVIRPTTGGIAVNGSIGTLVDITAGFQFEMTGRENVYVAAALLGLTKRQTNERLPEILAFADIGDFIDTPVKRYSSGMLVRLGFAVDISINPDILLIDEVLAVGDASFQKKCFDRIGKLIDRGCTLVLASHNMVAIRDMCKRAIWLEKGKVIMIDDSQVVTKEYLNRSKK